MRTGRRIIIATLLIIPLLFSCSCMRYPNKGRIRTALKFLTLESPKPDSPPLALALHIYGQGKYAVLDDKSGESQTEALAYFANVAGTRGWIAMRPDMNLPMFAERAGRMPVESEPNMFLGILAAANAGLDYSLVTATGEAMDLSDFFAGMLYDLNLSDLRKDKEYIPGRDGNALGWTLAVLAGFGLTESELPIGHFRKEFSAGYQGQPTAVTIPYERVIKTTDLINIVLDRDLAWGPHAGLDELAGLALAVRAHRLALAEPSSNPDRLKKDVKAEKKYKVKKGKNPDKIKLDGAWLRARKRLEEALSAAQKHQLDDGTFTSGWVGGAAADKSAAARALYTARVVEIAALSLPAKKLREKWLAHAVRGLCDLVKNNLKELKTDPYAMAYTARALNVYSSRMPGGESMVPKPCAGNDCPF